MSSFDMDADKLAKKLNSMNKKYQVSYKEDFRHKIADSWPNSMDCSGARKDWGFDPQYNFETSIE